MSAQPAALYGPPVGGHDENVPTSRRVMLGQGALLLAGLLAGVESALIARRTPGYSVASSTVAMALMLLAGWALLAAGVVLLRKVEKRSVGALLGAASLAWFIAQWDSAWAGSALVFGAGLVLGSVCPVLVAACRPEAKGHAEPAGRRSAWLLLCRHCGCRWASKSAVLRPPNRRMQ